MKVVVAMNAFKGSLSAVEATSAVAEGFRRGYREAEVVESPMSDGGDGFVDVITQALGGRFESHVVTGPCGDPVEARIGIVDFGQTAIIESASASGLALVPPEGRNGAAAHSKGVGELLLRAASLGVKRVVVGIGGTAMNDGGIGAVQAAGGLVLDSRGMQVETGLRGLSQVGRVGAGTIPETFRGIEIIAACDVRNPLFGEDGATRVYGPQKGLRPEEVSEADAGMRRYASILGRDLGKNPMDLPMMGAGGGLAAGLWAFFGARLVNGAKFVMEETGLLDSLAGADLVITGEGRIDSQTAKGKVPAAVARAASERGIPAVAIAGALARDVLEDYPFDFSALFSAVPRPATLEQAMAEARENLVFTAEQVGRLARACAMFFPAETEECAGGVVVRGSGAEREILVIADRYGFVALPKGHREPGETSEEAALREVSEETGIKVEIMCSVGDTTYAFPGRDGRPVRKTVHYFLMRPAGGDLRAQPGEILEAMWVRPQDLSKMKTYRDTRLVIERALGSLDELEGVFQVERLP